MQCRVLSQVVSFKSCPREGASALKKDYIAVVIVSSHAPVRGHLLGGFVVQLLRGFKSCPREGASPPLSAADRREGCFKSCPREGASRVSAFSRSLICMVSSHAPVRGHLYPNRSRRSS